MKFVVEPVYLSGGDLEQLRRIDAKQGITFLIWTFLNTV